MKVNDAKSNPSIGFLTVAEYPEFGLFGGMKDLPIFGEPYRSTV